jgi:thioredoxin-like negative regulator of GroEL
VKSFSYASLNKYIAGKSQVLLMVYANWCSHCNELKPEWDKLPAQLATKPGLEDVKVVKLNGDKYKQIIEEHQIEGYP